jgi:ORF6N domain
MKLLQKLKPFDRKTGRLNVVIDADLAKLYRVPTKSLNLAVKRNADRFPDDFTFQLTDDEVAGLRFHFETSKRGRGGRRYLPGAFCL